jgi:hypothetical protein
VRLFPGLAGSLRLGQYVATANTLSWFLLCLFASLLHLRESSHILRQCTTKSSSSNSNIHHKM